MLEPPALDLVANLVAEDFSAKLIGLFPTLGDLPLKHDGAIGDEAERAREDFEALFIVPTGRYLKPFESVYAEPGLNGLLMGPPACSALHYYRLGGAALGQKGGILPDHIGVETSFMEFLCAEEQNAWHDGSEDRAIQALLLQAQFLSSHLARWVPELADLMERNAEGIFYKAVSRLLREVVAKDLAILDFILPAAASQQE